MIGSLGGFYGFRIGRLRAPFTYCHTQFLDWYFKVVVVGVVVRVSQMLRLWFEFEVVALHPSSNSSYQLTPPGSLLAAIDLYLGLLGRIDGFWGPWGPSTNKRQMYLSH